MTMRMFQVMISTDGVMYFAKRLFASRPEKEPTSDNDSDRDDSMEWKK